MRSRNGFTLVETLVVVVMLGLVVLIGFPKVSSAMSRSDLRSARTAVVNLLAKARAVAAQSNRRTWVKLDGNTAYVVARPRLIAAGGGAPDPCDTVGAVQNLAAQYKVGLASDAPGDSIAFSPRGLSTWGAGGIANVVLVRGSYSTTITVDGLGRVTK